ncbi:MAG: Wzz/FepE/Etk N-terminal domain-containing protein [Pseudomonadota bacterium]
MASSLTSNGTVSQEISLSYVLERLWAAKFLIAIFVIAVTGLVYLYTQTSSPKFRSEAQIIVEPQETAFTRPQAEAGQNIEVVDERAIASEVQVVRSQDLVLDVIEELNLTENPLLDPARKGPSLAKSVFIFFGLSEDPLRLSIEERVLSNFYRGLTVYAIPESRVIVVGYESRDPELSAAIANALVDRYLESQQVAQATNTLSATSFLETEIAQLREQVAAAEASVARFRAGSGLFLGANQTTLSAQRLSELNTEVTRVRAEQSESQSRADEIRALISSQGSRLELPDSFATPLTQRLQEEQATLRGRIAELSASLLPGHPRIQELNAQLSDLSQQTRTEAQRIAQRFDNEAQVAAARAVGLEDQLGGLRAEASRLADAEVELQALEREAAAQRDLLASYLVRFREAATRDNADMLPTNARIIQTAQIERDQVFPQTLPMIMIAFVGSLVMSLLAVVSYAILSGTVPASRWDEPGMHPMGYNGNGHDAPRQPAFVSASPIPMQSPPSLPRAYRLSDGTSSAQLFAELNRLSRSGQGTCTTLAAIPGNNQAGMDGLLLARAAAKSGRATTYIDCIGDLAGLIPVPDGPGFYELVTGAAGFDEALHRDPESPLHIVPAGFQKAEPHMVADDAADLIFSALSEAYDLVLINTGRDGSLLVDCARITDAVAILGSGHADLAMVAALEPVVSKDRVVMVQVSGGAALAA